MLKFRKTSFAVSAFVVLAIMLAACGDTATPATTSAAAGAAGTTAATAATTTTSSGTTALSSVTPAAGTTTSSATTSAAAGATTTSSAATTSGTISGATTTSGTAMASGTPAMTGGTMMSGTMMASGTPAMTAGTAAAGTTNFPTISGATVVASDQTIAPALAQQLATIGIKPNGVQFYVSDNDPATLATAADTAITGGGYKFNIPGFSKPLTLPGASNTIGLYNLSGQPDLLLLIAAVPTDPTKVNSTFLLPGLSSSNDQQIVTALQGHKSAMILISGANLQQAILTLVTGAAKSMPSGAGATSGAVSNVTPTTVATP